MLAKGIAALLGLAAGAYATLLRRRLLRSGATPGETRKPMGSEHLIPGGRRGSTMAATIAAEPGRVWPWLVQMGGDRAGWYGWDHLDHWGVPSAEVLHPEWQWITVGQRLPASRDGKTWFEVAAVEPERFLALRASVDLRGRSYDPTRGRPRFYTDTLWTFQLEPLPGGRTRLIVTTYGVSRPRALAAILGFFFWEPVHFIMQRHQFKNLKRRAERRRLEKPLPLKPRPVG